MEKMTGIFKVVNDARLSILKNFSTKELMNELRSRGKTVSKKGVK